MVSSVTLVRCTEYAKEQVEGAVRQAVDLLGGMSRFVQPGQRVLVKPNLLQSSDPAKAIITHPTVVRAVVKLVDTSSFLSECDVVISVPKLKTHSLMRYTGAVKNLFGIVPGTTKAGYHVKLQTAERFAVMLLDLASFVQPALTVMDAVVGMDGDGPSAGQPFPIGAIMAAPDPVALDVAALALVGHKPVSVPTVAGAVARGWTTGRTSDLEILGEDLAALAVSGFRLPPGGRSEMDYVPPFLRPVGTRILVPSPFVTGLCTGCGLCIENCPVQTIYRVRERAQIDLSDCIRCYCCHEVCPEQAIVLRQPWLGRKLARMASGSSH